MLTMPELRRAFVSHSTADDYYVAEMESFLRAAGFDDVFNDVSSIKPDAEFWPEIEKGIRECDTLVVVITAASNTSDWVRREVECARSLGKKIIPLWVEDCPVPPIFAARDVIDLRRRAQELLRTDITRIFKYAPVELIGREDEKKLISEAWAKALRAENGRPNVLTFVALGGEGKTSLVAKWVVDEMSAKGWPGCDAAFAWSFYSQGTRDQVAASSDLFLKEALTFFASGTKEEVEEIKAFADSPAGAHEKGKRLARIVGQRRCLLILDGLEPLQYSPASPTPGELKDQGIAAPLKGLAAGSNGLCIVTTRYSVPNLKAFWQTTAPEVKLLRLSREAGVHLLKTFDVRGSERRNLLLKEGDEKSEKVNELEKLVEDVKGHALTLTLLGSYLRDAHGGDIRKRDLVKLEEADAEEQSGHAFRVMEAYERAFEDEGDRGQRALAILRLLGLFDRPMTADCFAALVAVPAVPGLTDPLIGLTDAQMNVAISRLQAARLLTVNRGELSHPPSAIGPWQSLDAHPLLREYFARQLRKHHPDAWRAAHRRLYEHLCATAPDSTKVHSFCRMLGVNFYSDPTLEDLQPLYQAVAHACYSGLHEKAWTKVFLPRILRGDRFYSYQVLGATGSDLGALACFFDIKWTHLSPLITESTRGRVLNSTGLRLRMLGRLLEAEAVLTDAVAVGAQQDPETTLRNLGEVELELGNITAAIQSLERCVKLAKIKHDRSQMVMVGAAYADALHQAGQKGKAKAWFQKAESLLNGQTHVGELLTSLHGFHYCDHLLAIPEIATWRAMFWRARETGIQTLIADCRAVSKRAKQTLKLAKKRATPLEVGLDHLTVGRAAFYLRWLNNPKPKRGNMGLNKVKINLDAAVSSLHRAGTTNWIPSALLTRAWLRFLSGASTGPESAQEDLDEAWEIAERGPMKLFMADIHLYRARLFFREASYPWNKNSDGTPRGPEDDLAAAETLIKSCGYHRRDEELEDAKAALKARA